MRIRFGCGLDARIYGSCTHTDSIWTQDCKLEASKYPECSATTNSFKDSLGPTANAQGSQISRSPSNDSHPAFPTSTFQN